MPHRDGGCRVWHGWPARGTAEADGGAARCDAAVSAALVAAAAVAASAEP